MIIIIPGKIPVPEEKDYENAEYEKCSGNTYTYWRPTEIEHYTPNNIPTKTALLGAARILRKVLDTFAKEKRSCGTLGHRL